MNQQTRTPSAVTGSRWGRFGIYAGGAVVILALVVLGARWLTGTAPVSEFMTTYPGQVPLPAVAPVGLPAWLGWQHFLNAFFIVLLVLTGWRVRTTQRPAAHWVRNNKGLIKTKKAPKRISLDLWMHLSLDVLWVLNGTIFIVLLFSTGQWRRIVPTSWDIIPNAVSAGLQYVSLNWPLDDGWVNYNSLQLLTYFLTVFVAAPLAIITGLRMSSIWPTKAKRLNRLYPIEAARALHFPVMLYFVLFVVVHVTLVLSTGALRNLNHMFAARDDGGWLGFIFFAISLVVIVGAALLARPIFVGPIASLMGKVSR
ncbi:MAG: cytochrome b/b6 domain-containing protein [Arthrobacter sp.]|uniref:cytochrome b/b6 domain-containing protein n=1 Tax=unclassified Arthrobacter TaxID=235627 RepID=UPI003FB6A56A